ncbi:MurR/RpiR family transcriptional regulator [Enterococcus raffinosus]|jgi:DNA-binding MurR/RpiR family transcriptional regulator|uniref:SIS domain-containing protein n=1 Tax=Enterococcus raffinosus TaxID=71452 RepID=A0AAW8SRU6_9ENTE|nr:SIS domain-containing protein [Enterococcus raffinosus]MBS6430375.1 MurR/RpiR family transcriptional regulator [Enterococcus raffinosus]MDK7989120.1 SIS domain-containing protein [Enterococcus raffinosus]MDT2536766.1 SIS domain-containing protein [Enterococcus raffinosus]MDT2570563.1 SIS domain-containing protein [Enterococcus raffinosus]QXJ60779.1 MurR/RpiR family transcriptional regulator [Enterococcus raffinosus]
MDTETLIDKYQLNDSEAAVLRFMDKNRDSLKSLGIREVAKASYVSTATIINMAKKIGYSGYSELVFAYANKQSTTSSPKKFSNEERDEFIRLLSKYRDKRLMILGSGFSQNIANHFSEKLNLYGFRATANSHLEFLRERVEKDVLIIIISNSGDTFRLAELAKMAKDHQIDLIAFVGEKQSRIGQLATLTISTGTYAPQVLSEYQPNLFFGTTLNQFEILLSEALRSIFD